MAEATIMVIKVDLNCSKCYKKVKKILCKIPQIRDQVYDEKQNTMTIKVVCCSPEKIKQKINCKGGDSIKSIEILPPPKPKEPALPEESEKPKEPKKPKEPPKPKEKPPAAKTRQASKVTFVDHRLIRTQRVAGNATRSVRGGPSICYDGYYGRPVYDSWGGSGGGGCYRVNIRDYFCEENPNAACRII